MNGSKEGRKEWEGGDLFHSCSLFFPPSSKLLLTATADYWLLFLIILLQDDDNGITGAKRSATQRSATRLSTFRGCYRLRALLSFSLSLASDIQKEQQQQQPKEVKHNSSLIECRSLITAWDTRRASFLRSECSSSLSVLATRSTAIAINAIERKTNVAAARRKSRGTSLHSLWFQSMADSPLY